MLPPAWRRLVFCLLAGAACCPPASTDRQTLVLVDGAAAGDVSEIRHRAELWFHVRTPVEGEERPLEVPAVEEVRYREEVLALDPRGLPAACRIAYSLFRETEDHPVTGLRETPHSLQGKTVTVRREGEAVTVTVARGRLRAADREALAAEHRRRAHPFFPDRPLAPDDEWTVEAGRVAWLPEDFAGAAVRCRFVDVVREGGRPCARIRLSVRASGRAGAGEWHGDFFGDLYHALDLQRPIRRDWSASLRLDGAGEAGDSPNRREQGTVEARQTIRWLKIAGAPVPPPGAGPRPPDSGGDPGTAAAPGLSPAAGR